MEKKKTFGPMVTLLAIIKRRWYLSMGAPHDHTVLGLRAAFMSQLSTHILYGEKWFLIQTHCALHFVFVFCFSILFVFKKRILLRFPAGHNL